MAVAQGLEMSCLHCAEAVLNDPSASVDLYDFGRRAFKVSTYSRSINARSIKGR